MSETLVILHSTIAIVAIVLLILVVRLDPVIALVIGSIYLGLAAGLGFEGTIGTIAQGFGDIMAEVGLLIGFGVLLGSLLLSMGALQKLIEVLLRIFGPGKLPYAFAAALSTIFPAIYVDVQLVLAAPLARSAAPRMGRHGLAMMGGALSAGILVGYVFVVPGLGTVAIAGLIGIPLGTMLVYGTLIGLPTAVLTTFIYGRLLRYGFWNADRDEITLEEPGPSDPGTDEKVENEPDESPGAASAKGDKFPPLYVSLLPILLALLLIAFGAVVSAVGIESPVIAFFGDPVFALFAGMLGAYLLAWRTLPAGRVGESMNEGFNATGQILLITGLGGSLGAVIGESGLENILGGLFSAESGTPVFLTILLAWTIAAVLHLAIGSISVAAITAAGILAPIMGSLAAPELIIGLAIGSGALFALQVNSNFFWMFQTLLGVSTQGTLKALTFVTALASVVSLILVLVLSLVVV